MGTTDQPTTGNGSEIALAFRSARLSALPLAHFPGALPISLAAAYAVQEEAISAFPDKVGGWKVAGIAPDLRSKLGAERLAGPAFASRIRQPAGGEVVQFPVFAGGFAAVEAEFIFQIGRDVAGIEADDHAALGEAVASLHCGVETAGSPFAGINDLGPLSVIADFGNNDGLIIGPAIPNWRVTPLEAMTSETRINGVSVGRGSAALVAGGPITALAFLVRHLAMRGRVLRAGDFVSTGMTTGIHLVQTGDRIECSFAGDLTIRAEATKAQPRQ